MIVGCLGDSITAGSPLWDPDEACASGIETPDERSQWEWWAMRARPGPRPPEPRRLRRAHGPDRRAPRAAVDGAEALVVQGGINDIVQSRPVEEALQNLAGMV